MASRRACGGNGHPARTDRGTADQGGAGPRNADRRWEMEAGVEAGHGSWPGTLESHCSNCVDARTDGSDGRSQNDGSSFRLGDFCGKNAWPTIAAIVGRQSLSPCDEIPSQMSRQIRRRTPALVPESPREDDEITLPAGAIGRPSFCSVAKTGSTYRVIATTGRYWYFSGLARSRKHTRLPRRAM
ncbi:hypothetical protein MAPG_08438 [Magnaporthiopsis poae ATCC 64411]|uniref:Uncharacterized protein n=1 Tax=Magnaporthiopsis poae (strain ATCC 64411 / 73-15) TaxID=644358 RepID=A0A0C4E7C6_MAGP6|nr:hypothetical protein MAPG_08438 [Magnaporthiopsis poae ATCC 64411]